MPKLLEIDETELLDLRKLKTTIGSILANPKGKLLVQQAHKLVDPKAVTPELDTQEVINEPLKAVQQEIADFKKAQADRDAAADQEKKLAALTSTVESGIAELRRNGWTEEGIAGVRKIMDDEGIINPKLAAAYFEKQHPPQLPATPSGSGAWNFLEMPTEGGDADLKRLIETKGESNVLLDKMIRDSLTEVRGSRR